MKVIHFCPSNDIELMQYVRMMSDNSEEPLSTDSSNAFVNLCKDCRPDIVHLHGCDNDALLKLTSKAQQEGLRTVITTHGRFDFSSSVTHSILTKKVLANAYVVVARSRIEADEIRPLELNSRIEIVGNPLVTRTTTEEKMRQSYKHIYQNVMESDPLDLMNDATKRALHKLLKVGITDDERWVDPIDDVTSIDWHLLIIYAIHEGIYHYIERGIRAMRLSLKEEAKAAIDETISIGSDMSNIGGYLPDTYEKPVSFARSPIVDIVSGIKNLADEQCLSLLQIAELDQALRRTDVDDEYLMQQLNAAKLNRFFASLLTILAEQTLLDEGFMPCEPVNDATTRQLRTLIEDHLKI